MKKSSRICFKKIEEKICIIEENRGEYAISSFYNQWFHRNFLLDIYVI